MSENIHPESWKQAGAWLDAGELEMAVDDLESRKWIKAESLPWASLISYRHAPKPVERELRWLRECSKADHEAVNQKEIVKQCDDCKVFKLAEVLVATETEEKRDREIYNTAIDEADRRLQNIIVERSGDLVIVADCRVEILTLKKPGGE